VARAVRSSLKYDLDEWIAHADPSEAAQSEIVSLFESCVDDDRAGLDVHRDGERLRFRHRTAVFVLERAGET